MSNLKSRTEPFKKTIVLVDSTSAIETIALQYYYESLSMMKIKVIIRELNKNNEEVKFQWIQSHVDIEGNEKADELTKKGTVICIEQDPIPLDSLGKSIRKTLY